MKEAEKGERCARMMENTIWMQLQEEGIPCGQKDLHAILVSSFSKAYNPFEEYFRSLPQWDGETDYIGQLADTVKTPNQPFWHECLRKWIVAMTASVLFEDVVNHTVLILCGDQGLGKTKWCCNLIPPELSKYRYSGAINPASRDSMLTLSECILINLDEMEAFERKDMNRLKEMITKGVMRERRAYGMNIENYTRRASLTGSTNNHQILGDLTGLRRFLCQEVLAIDYLSPIDYKNVYSQAYALAKSGYRYWLNAAEIETLNEHNEHFRIRTPEEELFYTYFRKPTGTEGNIKYLTLTEMLEQMCRKTNLHLTHGGTIRLGMILKKEGFERLRHGNKYVFGVIEVPAEEVEDEKSKKPGVDDKTSESQSNMHF